MHQARDFFRDVPKWDNPTREFPHQPYLADEVFPLDPGAVAAGEALEVVERFYSEDRSDYTGDLRNLKAFLHSPNEQLFIIEGEVGIGKSWFVRHHLVAEQQAAGDASRAWHGGVLDLLRAGPGQAEQATYTQICPVLEEYFHRFFGSVESALTEHAKHIHARARGTERKAPGWLAGVKEKVNRWLGLDYGPEYAGVLLMALEGLKGPRLFLAIDNVDRLSPKDQECMVDIVTRILRNARIRLVVPLRTTTPLLLDRLRGLHEFRHDSMRLSKLNLETMARLRFTSTREGLVLKDYPIEDFSASFTFPDLFERMITGGSGDLIWKLSGGNCRICLMMLKRLLGSNHLRSLRNIGNVEFAIEALMLDSTSRPDKASPVLNLFDNEEKGVAGNTLIRLRVLEYFEQKVSVDPGEEEFRVYFGRLGYDTERVRSVLRRMLMTGMIFSRSGLDEKSFAQKNLTTAGELEITETGRAYLGFLVGKLWYFVAAKRGLAERMPASRVNTDPEKGHKYITDTDFMGYLREEVQEEMKRIRDWDRRFKKEVPDIQRRSPYRLARTALAAKRTGG